MKARELYQHRPFQDLLCFGESGSGKTSWACRSPQPLVLLTEEHGLASIAEWAPDADVELCNGFDDALSFMRALKTGRPIKIDDQVAFEVTYLGEKRVIQTVVIDSLTDLQEQVKNHVIGGPAKQITQSDWGRIGALMSSYLRDLRSLPVNVICLALADVSIDEYQSRYVRPALFGKLGARIGQWFSGVGYAAKRRLDKMIEYGIAWETSSRFLTKPPPGFPRYIRNTLTPGQTTLGSLLLASMGKYKGIAHLEEDSASFVEVFDG